MVKGLDLFRERFRAFEGAFVLIGGAACHEWFATQGAEFRPTKDLDIVLIVEMVDPAFVAGGRVAVLRQGGVVLAFATLLETGTGHEVAVDLMRHDRRLPNIGMEFLVIRLCEILKAEGVVFQTRSFVGSDVAVDEMRAEFDAICLAGGASYGLEAGAGVSGALLERLEYRTGFAEAQLVSSAVIYDFSARPTAVYPDKALGRAAHILQACP